MSHHRSAVASKSTGGPRVRALLWAVFSYSHVSSSAAWHFIPRMSSVSHKLPIDDTWDLTCRISQNTGNCTRLTGQMRWSYFRISTASPAILTNWRGSMRSTKADRLSAMLRCTTSSGNFTRKHPPTGSPCWRATDTRSPAPRIGTQRFFPPRIRASPGDGSGRSSPISPSRGSTARRTRRTVRPLTWSR